MMPTTRSKLPPMTAHAVDCVRQLETITRQCPQIRVETEHSLHAGMYARTIRLPAGIVLTGVLIKVATIVIVHGDCSVHTGDRLIDLCGYNVIEAAAGRKQVFITRGETVITMLFPTSAPTIEQAENEFTDEAHLLMSRSQTGE